MIDEFDELEVNLDELDLDKEIEEMDAIKKPKLKKVKIKKGKEPTATPQALPAGVTMTFIPDFDISEKNLDTKTYQVRRTKRTADEIFKLKTAIELQGQIEPIQVAIIDGKNYLIAGEGRVIALRALDKKAKAIVYTGLTPDEVLKISSGSNEFRLEMSEWDRCVSIGEYYDKNPDISKDDPSDKTSLISIFGFSRSNIYAYLKMWKFYKDKPEFFDYYAKQRVPLYVLAGVVEVLTDYQDKIDNYTEVVDILNRIVHRNDISRNNFTNLFIREMTDFILSIQLRGSCDMSIAEQPLDDPELAKVERKIKADIQKKIKLTEEEQIIKRVEECDTTKELQEKAESAIKSIDESLESAIMAIIELGEIDFHKVIHSSKIAGITKKIGKLNQMVTILM